MLSGSSRVASASFSVSHFALPSAASMPRSRYAGPGGSQAARPLDRGAQPQPSRSRIGPRSRYCRNTRDPGKTHIGTGTGRGGRRKTTERLRTLTNSGHRFALKLLQGSFKLADGGLEARVSALEGSSEAGGLVTRASSSSLPAPWLLLVGGLGFALGLLVLVQRSLTRDQSWSAE